MKQPKLTQLHRYLLILGLMAGSISVAFGQEKDSTVRSKNLPTDPPSRFSLVFNRTIPLAGPSRDSVPLSNTASGTYFIGGGFKFPFGRRNVIGLRVAPGLAWTHYTYQQSVDKEFPTIADSVGVDYTQEKHRLFFLELPVGLYFNVTRDEDGDPVFFGEVGGFVGYLASAQYKIRYRNNAGLRVQERTRDLEQISEPESEFERLRYGAYARIGYKWFSLYYSIRLTEVFDEFTNPDRRPKNVEGYKNPLMPAMEIGLSLFL